MCNFSYLYPIIRIYPLDVVDESVVLSLSQASCQVVATLVLDDDTTTPLLHSKVHLEQVVELVLLCFLHLRTEYLMGYITHVVLQNVSNTRKDNKG